MLSRKLLITREEGGCLLPGKICTNNERLVIDVLWVKQPNTRIPQVGDPQCSDFERYEEVPETLHLDFSEDNVIWVASKLSGAAGSLE